MKKTYNIRAGDKNYTGPYFYIPVRFIIAILIMFFEVVAVVAITMALCYFVPYFYIAAWITEIFCVLRIISSDNNPEYKVPWLPKADIASDPSRICNTLLIYSFIILEQM